MDAYETVRRIGKGSEGSVYLVRRKATQREFVVKKIYVRSGRASSHQEAAILAQLKHPHIVRYEESFWDPEHDHLCIVQEYCARGTLEQQVAAEKQQGAHFSEERIMSWFVQVLLALSYIHSKRILHRDLKTANIFLTDKNIIKVGDFGISAQLEHTLDMKRTCVGSPFYMSPEVCQDIPYNSKSDIWALGCVLYELCALTPAFAGTSLMKIVTKILACNYEPLPSIYSNELISLIASLLNPRPEQRPSIAEIAQQPYVQQALKAFISATSETILYASIRGSPASASADTQRRQEAETPEKKGPPSGPSKSGEPKRSVSSATTTGAAGKGKKALARSSLPEETLHGEDGSKRSGSGRKRTRSLPSPPPTAPAACAVPATTEAVVTAAAKSSSAKLSAKSSTDSSGTGKKKKKKPGKRKLPPGTIKRCVAPTPGSFDRPEEDGEVEREPSVQAPAARPQQRPLAATISEEASPCASLLATDESPALASALLQALNATGSTMGDNTTRPTADSAESPEAEYEDDFESPPSDEEVHNEEREDRSEVAMATPPPPPIGDGDGAFDKDSSQLTSPGSEIDTDDDCKASLTYARMALAIKAAAEFDVDECVADKRPAPSTVCLREHCVRALGQDKFDQVIGLYQQQQQHGIGTAISDARLLEVVQPEELPACALILELLQLERSAV